MDIKAIQTKLVEAGHLGAELQKRTGGILGSIFGSKPAPAPTAPKPIPPKVAASSPAVDGDFGPKTLAAVLDYAAGRPLGATGVALARAMAADFPRYGLTTDLRVAHFLAQCAHETGGFRHFVELGSGDKNGDGLDDYLLKYDKRTDLGNTPQVDGDGQKYRGRGIFQLTGRANYERYGKRIGIDLVNEPKRAAEPEVAVLTACLYWSDRKLNEFADADDVKTITKKINGGYNGLDDRIKYLNKLKKLLSQY